MHKNVFTSPVSFTGSYTEDEPNFPTNFTEKVSGVDKVVNFKDFLRQLVKFKTLSRLYEPWNSQVWFQTKITWHKVQLPLYYSYD